MKLITVLIFWGFKDEIIHEWMLLCITSVYYDLCLINAYVPFFFMLWSWLHTHMHDVCASNFMNTNGWTWFKLCVWLISGETAVTDVQFTIQICLWLHSASVPLRRNSCILSLIHYTADNECSIPKYPLHDIWVCSEYNKQGPSL